MLQTAVLTLLPLILLRHYIFCHTDLTHYFYSAPVGVWSIEINRLCMSVCLRVYLWNRWTDLHVIFCADPVWPWLGLAAAALCYIMCFRFLSMTSHLAVMGVTPARLSSTRCRRSIMCTIGPESYVYESLLIFDIRVLWRSAVRTRVSEYQK